MKYLIPRLLFLLTLTAVSASAQTGAGNGRSMSLTLPKAPAQTDNIWLQVKIGNLAKGTEVEIWSVKGRFLGSISPFGAASRNPADSSTYTVPIPRDAVKDDRFEFQLVVKGLNNSERAPTKKDVRGVKLKITSKDR